MAWFHSFLPGFEKYHMVILASICWAIWNIRNRVTFDKFQLKSPGVITFYSISLLIYWVGLQKDATDKERLIEGANRLKQVATLVYSRQVEDSHQLAIVTMT
jgi:glucose dehydrogenase